MNHLNDVLEMLSDSGQPMAGLDMTDEQALAHMQSLDLIKKFCLVRDWIWLDLDVTDEQLSVLEKTQRQPVLIYAHRVIYDSAQRWDAGDFVRTSYLHRFEEGFLFYTNNTAYVLLGDGVRKRVSFEVPGQIF